MGRSWLKNMGEDLPVIFPTKAEQRAAYRLLSNPRISMEHVLEPHFEATADRCRAEPVVLAIQDATALNCSGLEATTGLDGIGGGGKGSVGILAHAGLAVTSEGRPLGLFAMDAAFREDPEEDSRRRVEGLGRARELAAACPDTRVVSVCDREGDFWDLLAHAVDDGDDPLHWLLLTTERPAEDEADAVHAATVLGWYRLRWTVETWFRTIKTGTRIKDRRLDSADDLRKCLAFDAVTAVHVADSPSSRGSARKPRRPKCSLKRTWTCFTRCWNLKATGMSSGCPPGRCPTFTPLSSISGASSAPIQTLASRFRARKKSGKGSKGSTGRYRRVTPSARKGGNRITYTGVAG